jgi:hypothetical protein
MDQNIRGKPETLNLRIGGVTIAVAPGPGDCPPLALPSPEDRFLVDNGAPDILLRLHYGDLPALPPESEVLQTGAARWSLYRVRDGYAIPLILGDHRHSRRLAVMNRAFTAGDLFIQRWESGSAIPAVQVTIDPLLFPTAELLMLNYLARGRLGVIIHSLGLDDGGRGLLFVGVSGAGKSTMANLWQGSGATLLSDDRIILRRQDDRYMMYGTPWHGDANIASPEAVPLERIYFLARSSENHVQPLSTMEAVTRLMVCCFPPFYNPEGMEFNLEFLSQLAAEMPCYKLGVMPDFRVVEFVRGLR